MLHSTVFPSDSAAYLAGHQPDLPVHFYAAAQLEDRLQHFLTGFPGLVTYAVKANPSETVLNTLVQGGISGFDVASPEEIALVRRIAPYAALHYNNPVRSLREITIGVQAGVCSWSVDEPGELDKLIAQGVGPKHEIAVRFKLPVKGAAYDFGAKFGAMPDQAVAMLKTVERYGMTPALTFHVGTQCSDPQAYATYIAAAIDIAKRAGVTIARLNVGGGFPSARDGKPVDLTPFFTAITAAVAGFENRPDLVCEPGRGLVADAFSYGVQVKSVRAGHIYLTDGIYGGLSEFPSMVIPVYRILGQGGATRSSRTAPFVVFGPTCDSLDQLPHPLDLPVDIAEGDWLIFSSMGAYLTGVTTRFNGYGDRETIPVSCLT